MATSNGEEPRSSCMAANAPAVPMAARPMLATDRGERQDCTTMVGALASSGEASAEAKIEDTANPCMGSMDPLLLCLASRGDCCNINYFLNMESTPATGASHNVPESNYPSNDSNTTMATHQASVFQQMTQQSSGGAAEQQGVCHPAPSAESRLQIEISDRPIPPEILTLNPRLDLEGVTIEGATALHVVATCGDDSSYFRSARIIYDKAKHLLLAQNNNGDTPLHCAVRAGNPGMVCCLINLARKEDNSANSSRLMKELVRKENHCKETALHDAVRIGNDVIVKQLIKIDSELASFPLDGIGTSPLYLAIMLQRVNTAMLLFQNTEGKLSYFGPNGPKAWQTAVLQGKVMTEILLKWKDKGIEQQGDQNGGTPENEDRRTPEMFLDCPVERESYRNTLLACKKDLEETTDQYGSTPLHFAASVLSGRPLVQVLLHNNPIQLYQPNSEGWYPIHVAAYTGAEQTVCYFIRKHPEIACLRDSKGRSFLHIAVEWNRWNIVAYACRSPWLARILNMQDNDGNTAMHIAVQHGKKYIFCVLLRNRTVNINILNNKGQTPLDISQSNIPTGFSYLWNPEKMILLALTLCNASTGGQVGHFHDRYMPQQKQAGEEKESEKLTNTTQTLGIASVLVATVTFGTILAIPGGYKADDHFNGGTPTLAGRYTFDAFIMANTIAFICSVLSTINLMFSGMHMVGLRLRFGHFVICLFLAFSSVTSLGAAFALGMFLVLAPVARWTAITICAMMMIASLCFYADLLYGASVARALYVRRGNWVLSCIARVFLFRTLMIYWPCVIIFGWAAISTRYGHR